MGWPHLLLQTPSTVVNHLYVREVVCMQQLLHSMSFGMIQRSCCLASYLYSCIRQGTFIGKHPALYMTSRLMLPGDGQHPEMDAQS